MHIAIWIFTLIGLVIWSLLAWGLHALLSIDPKWLDDVEALVRRVPYAELIERWFPGWQQLLGLAMDLAQTVLGWVGSNAPLVAWIVWGHRRARAFGHRRRAVAAGLPAQRKEGAAAEAGAVNVAACAPSA